MDGLMMPRNPRRGTAFLQTASGAKRRCASKTDLTLPAGKKNPGFLIRGTDANFLKGTESPLGDSTGA